MQIPILRILPVVRKYSALAREFGSEFLGYKGGFRAKSGGSIFR